MACSVYGSQFLMDGLYEAGEADYALQLLTSDAERSWYNMIRVGSTISLEAWDDKYKPNQDWNHAWGAAPANIIPRRLMGVVPTEPGFSRIEIRPQPAGLEKASLRIPTIRGDVETAFTASVGDLANEESTSNVMTCTCGGNPAGGRAIVTADVTGIPVEHLLAKAGAAPGANAVTFVSADGTQQTFPLGYVVGRHAVLSYEINDEDLSASVGGSNQLWMTKTPANYFVRDVVEIVVSTEDVAPATPGAAG